MAKKRYIWVLPQGEVWVVKKEKAGRASAIRNTKREAYGKPPMKCILSA